MSITSELRVFPSRENRKITGYWDHKEETSIDAPFVILSPKFGETKKNNIHLAYMLVESGLNAFRFDHLDHTGESEGNIMDYTFKGATSDIIDVVQYLHREFQAREVILLASSMSVRPAIRAAALDSRIARFISMVGMVNFQYTSKAVYREDMVDLHRKGKHIGNTDILGHEVHVSRFLEGTIRENMHDLSGTLEDLGRSTADFFFICGEQDAWIDRKDIERLRECREDVRILWIENAMHELRENPFSADLSMREAVFACKYGRFSKNQNELSTIVEPDLSDVLRQNRKERKRLKKISPLKGSETHFWNGYLKKYGILEYVDDFQEYLELVSDALGPIRPNHCLLDVGCGNGLFGLACIRRLMDQEENVDSESIPLYFGLDLTRDGLAEAMTRHAASQRLLMREKERPRSWIDFAYLPYNLEVLGRSGEESPLQLPFETNTFDKICCSLLLSYLENPARVVHECFRVLKPGGRIIISSMKPYCDLSSLYSRLVVDTEDPEVLNQARNLLSAAGAIRLKEEHGQYTFYSTNELNQFAEDAGLRDIQAFRSFGNQANLIAASK